VEKIGNVKQNKSRNYFLSKDKNQM